jgi:hypothetical protein
VAEACGRAGLSTALGFSGLQAAQNCAGAIIPNDSP